MVCRSHPVIALAASFFVLAASGGGCGEDPKGGDPFITLLTPEPGQRAREFLAVSGETSGYVGEVKVQIDDDAANALVATQDGDTWFALVDVSTLADGSHVVTATAYGSGDKTDVSPPRRFLSLAHAAPGTLVIEGQVNDLTTQDPLPDATVSVLSGSLTTEVDALGGYALAGVVPDLPIVMRAEMPAPAGFWATNMFRVAQGNDTRDINFPLAAGPAVDFIATEYAVTQDPAKGIVIGFLVDGGGGVAGATVALSQPAEGPFYLGEGPDPFDPAMTATGPRGQFLFFNVDPGPVDFTATAGTASFFTLGSIAQDRTLSLVGGFVIP